MISNALSFPTVSNGVTTYAANGAAVLSYETKKSFGARKGLKGAALRVAHADYRRDFGLSLNKSIAGALADGSIIAQKVRGTKAGDGFGVSFVAPVKLEVKPLKGADVSKKVTEAVDAEKAAALADKLKAREAMVAKLGCTIEDANAILGIAE